MKKSSSPKGVMVKNAITPSNKYDCHLPTGCSVLRNYKGRS